MLHQLDHERHTHPANFAYLMASGKLRVSYVGGESAELDGRTGQVLWSDPGDRSWIPLGPSRPCTAPVTARAGLQ